MKNLLSVTNTLVRDQSKTNVIHKFFVDNDYIKLLIKFSYFPKKMVDNKKALELIKESMAFYAPSPYQDAYGTAESYLPIVNLLTISLDSPNGYRGAAHRHDPSQEHTLSVDFASPGFYKGEIQCGQWQVVVNSHCIASDTCTYMLEVYGEEAR